MKALASLAADALEWLTRWGGESASPAPPASLPETKTKPLMTPLWEFACETTLHGKSPLDVLCAAHLAALARKDTPRANEMLNALRAAGGHKDSSTTQRSWLSTALFDAHRAMLHEQPQRARELLTELGDLAHGPDATEEQRTQLAVALHNERVAAEARGDERAVRLLRAELAVLRPPADITQRALALHAAGNTFFELGDNRGMQRALTRIVNECSTCADDAVRTIVAGALMCVAQHLGNEGQVDQEVALYCRVMSEFDVRVTIQGRRNVANTLFNLSRRLKECGRPEQSLVALSELVQRCRDETDETLQEFFAMALVNRGAQQMAGAVRPALQDFDELLTRFNRAPGPQFRRQVAFALCNKALALQSLNNEPAAADTLQELVARFARDPDPAIQNALTTALENHSHPTPARPAPS